MFVRSPGEESTSGKRQTSLVESLVGILMTLNGLYSALQALVRLIKPFSLIAFLIPCPLSLCQIPFRDNRLSDAIHFVMAIPFHGEGHNLKEVNCRPRRFCSFLSLGTWPRSTRKRPVQFHRRHRSKSASANPPVHFAAYLARFLEF